MHFNLNGNMNTKNCVHWVDTKLCAIAPVPLFDAKVWCSITGAVVLVPYYFKEVIPTAFVACSVKASCYTGMLFFFFFFFFFFVGNKAKKCVNIQPMLYFK